MRKFGLVGGVGYQSTLDYYKNINEGYQRRVGSQSKSGENPPMVIESLNLATAYALVEKKDWNGFVDLFVNAVRVLHGAGADFAAIAANTAHIVIDEIRARSPIPIICIVDETCRHAQKLGLKRLIVFGTGFTMDSGMYEAKCRQYGIRAFAPCEADRRVIHDIIFPNLEAGIVLPNEKTSILAIADKMLTQHKADALVLGCTELSLAVWGRDLGTTLLDTGRIHIEAILDFITA